MRNQDFWDNISATYNSYYQSRWSEYEDSVVSTWLHLSALGGRVLDIGCGTGYVGRLLSQCDASIVGVDASPGMLKIAAGTQAYQNLLLHDLNEGLPPLSEEFDAIVSTWGSLNYLREPLHSLASLTTLLRKGGVLQVMVFNRGSLRRLSSARLGSVEEYGTRGNTSESALITIPSNADWRKALSQCFIRPVHITTLGAFSGLAEWKMLWPLDRALTAALPIGHMSLITGGKTCSR